MKGKTRMKRMIGLVSVAFFLLTLCVQPVAAQQVLSDNKKKAVDTVEATTQNQERFDADAPETKESASTNKYLLYGGAAALIVGAAALAGGGGGGSSEPACEEELVGPSIAGSDWSGSLILAANGSQAVTASITQCGNRVLIITSSALDYGQRFEGTIDSGGDMIVIDSVTGEDWTTHFGSASSTSINLYDFVNNFKEMDKLQISRTLAAQ